VSQGQSLGHVQWRAVVHGVVIGPVRGTDGPVTVHVTRVDGGPAALVGCDVDVQIDPATEIGWVGDSEIRDGTRVRILAEGTGACESPVRQRARDMNVDNSTYRPLTNLEYPSQG
jgi:hypothetical protein